MSVLYLNEQNFNKEIENQNLPVVLDFYADWCGPCQSFAPILEEVANKYEGRIKVGKINVDDSPNLAARFQVLSIPTLVFLKNGKKVNEAIGVIEEEKLEKYFEELLK